MSQFIAFSFVGAFLAAVLFTPMPSYAGPVGPAAYPVDASMAQDVGYYKKRRWWRAWDDEYDGNARVRAPTTSVDTNNANTDVEAPFTSVRKSPRGTWVRAPFVNLFVPRD
ncbi:MAG: hypothetical protein ACREDO_10720 [Methyloceanibacter sp.]